MYIIKVRFDKEQAFPEVQIIDSALHTPDWFLASQETENVEDSLGYGITRDSFSYFIARRIAEETLQHVFHGTLDYKYTDGFLPDATFVFEYDR